MLICGICRYCGHSMGVIPGLVSIPVVKSFCVLFVYYGFLWEFHFAASLLYYNYLLYLFCLILLIFLMFYYITERLLYCDDQYYFIIIVLIRYYYGIRNSI